MWKVVVSVVVVSKDIFVIFQPTVRVSTISSEAMHCDDRTVKRPADACREGSVLTCIPSFCGRRRHFGDSMRPCDPATQND